MSSTTAIAPDLAARAREAWGYMTQAVNPMPAMYALDWMMNDLTDDRAACKRALYGAAADVTHRARPHINTWWVTPQDFRDYLYAGDLHSAQRKSEHIRSYKGKVSFDDPETNGELWLAWCDRADAALALCRLIEATP